MNYTDDQLKQLLVNSELQNALRTKGQIAARAIARDLRLDDGEECSLGLALDAWLERELAAPEAALFEAKFEQFGEHQLGVQLHSKLLEIERLNTELAAVTAERNVLKLKLNSNE